MPEVRGALGVDGGKPTEFARVRGVADLAVELPEVCRAMIENAPSNK
jgi:hypothetical protein